MDGPGFAACSGWWPHGAIVEKLKIIPFVKFLRSFKISCVPNLRVISPFQRWLTRKMSKINRLVKKVGILLFLQLFTEFRIILRFDWSHMSSAFRTTGILPEHSQTARSARRHRAGEPQRPSLRRHRRNSTDIRNVYWVLLNYSSDLNFQYRYVIMFLIDCRIRRNDKFRRCKGFHFLMNKIPVKRVRILKNN